MDKRRAELNFYRAVGPELENLVVISDEGLTLDGFFTDAQLNKILWARNQYREAVQPIESNQG